MNDIIEDEDNDLPVTGLPTWIWASAVVLMTLALLAYVFSR